jgi:hypothetical protein
MMDETDVQRFKDISKRYAAGETIDALLDLRAMIQSVADPLDKAGLLYHEVLSLLDLGKVPQARKGIDELKRLISSFAASLADADHVDLRVSVSVMALFAEAKILTKEGRDSAALQVLENLMSEYPKQLSLSNFREILGETQMLRGLLLANADRWQEAGPYLESASPPTAMESVFCY